MLFNCNTITITRRHSKKAIILKRHADCFECISHKKDRYGYSQIEFCHKTYKMHRFIYCLLTDKDLNDIKGLYLQHSCDNRLCCSPLHLIPGTHNDNMQDMKNKNRSCWGEKNGRAKLTNIDTLTIYNSDMPLDYLAEI